jgi:hypothetical protein
MNFKMTSVFLAAVLAFAMAPAHAGKGGTKGSSNSNSNSSSNNSQSNSGGPSEQGRRNGQGHIKYANNELPGKGTGHAKHHDFSKSE